MSNIKLPALSIRRPYMDLIVAGAKTIETRKWRTDYRGRILLHCSQSVDADFPKDVLEKLKLPFGSLIATADLVRILPYTKEHAEKAFVQYNTDERVYSWFLEDIQLIHPIQYKGRQGLFWLSVPERLLDPIDRMNHNLINYSINEFLNAGKKIKNIKKTKES